MRNNAVLFSEVIDEILSDVTPSKRVGTQELHFIYLGELKRELGDRKLESFGRKEYAEWMRGFRKRKKRKTFFDYTKFLNLIFNYAYQMRYITHLVRFPQTDQEKEKIGRVYSKELIKKLWDVMDETMRLQFVLSFECFMRLREVLHLTWDRVDLDSRTIILRKQDVKTGSRTGHGRDVPMSENAYKMLLALSRSAPDRQQAVFPAPDGSGSVDSNRRAWATAKRKAGIRGRARWHDIRHTALTYATLEKRVPVAHLSKVAGLSMRTLERVYLHGDIEQLRCVTDVMNVLKLAGFLIANMILNCPMDMVV